ncbi:MAG: helix-turn-helix transcriptional regulator, partial [Candidatus Eremiobacteraeota bacterium]|nr:helix-turn-helix transcriptional regulator [Candidatus Eremiobacteraeota bacterium]
MPQEFGTQLRQARTRQKMTQETLASLARIDKAYISNLEHGKRLPSVDVVDRLAKALEIPALDLIGGTDVMAKYAEERNILSELAAHVQAESCRRSEKAVAIHEVYRRIVGLFRLHLSGHVLNSADAHGEAYLAFLLELLTEKCAIANEDLGDVFERDKLFAPANLDPSRYVDDGFFDNEFQEEEERKLRASEATILKVVLRHPEADTEASRRDISERLRLNQVDTYMEKLEK